jgi:uncharacterized membrane protein YbaN (DUF454 family)
VNDRPRIEIDEQQRTIQVRDPRIINPDQRAFCQRLLEHAAVRSGVSKVEVDLPASTCRVEFASGPATSRQIADAFADCVHNATADLAGERSGSRWHPDEAWLTLTAYPLSRDVSLWATSKAKPGPIGLGHHGPFSNGDQIIQVAKDLKHHDAIEQCRVSEGSRRPSVRRGVGSIVAAGFENSNRSVEVVTGPRRLIYLALAGGAFAMTVVAIVVPGIPTTPFLLATSYALARSSPRLNLLLRQSAFFGPIVDEWEQHGGFSRSSKVKLISLTAAVAMVAIAISPLSPVAVFLVLLVCASGIFGISRLPGLPEECAAGTANDGPVRFALPAI